MTRFKLRRFVSLSMVLLAAVLTYTGIVLFIAPHGRVAYWTDWHFLGLSKDHLTGIHTTCSFLFVAMGLLHTYLNWKPILTYLKNKAKQLRVFTAEMIAASILVVLFLAGTALGLPPFQQVVDLGEAIKDWREERLGGPPYGHAELSTLSTLTRRMGWDGEACVRTLQDEGLTLQGDDPSFADIAEANGMTPAALFTVLEQAEACSAGGRASGAGGAGGRGGGRRNAGAP